MTEAEFRNSMNDFWAWVSKRERPAHHWYLSLEEWAATKYNEAYEKGNVHHGNNH